jgi:hypothetical protein
MLYLFGKNDILNRYIDKIDEHTSVSIHPSSSRVQAF